MVFVMADANNQDLVSAKHDGIDYEALYCSAIKKSAFFRTALCVLAIYFFGSWIAETALGSSPMLDAITFQVMASVFCAAICLRIGTMGIPLLAGNLTWKKILLLALIFSIGDVLFIDAILYCRGGKEYLHYFSQNEFLLGNLIQSGNDIFFGPLVEEFLFRGFLQTLLQPFTPIVSVMATSSLFAFWHTDIPFPEGKFLVFLEFLPGALILSLLRQRTKSMAACLLTHAFYNFFTHFDPIKFFASRSLLGF